MANENSEMALVQAVEEISRRQKEKSRFASIKNDELQKLHQFV